MTPPTQARFLRLPHGEGLPAPARASAQAAGWDLPCAQAIHLAPGARARIGTGFALALPADMEAQVRSRSGLAWRDGVCVLNAPGTIDPDYQGEILVILVNHSDTPFVAKRGARIAQVVFARLPRDPVMAEGMAENDEAALLRARGTRGFGSTGT